MSDSSNFGESITNASLTLSSAMLNAAIQEAQAVGEPIDEISLGATHSRTEIKKGKPGEIQEVTVTFDGPQAPILARPFHTIINKILPDSERRGGTDQERTIEASGYEHCIAAAGADLAEFANATQEPSAQKMVTEMTAVALQLERQAAPCKVGIEFHVSAKGALAVEIDNVITASNGALAQALKGKPGIRAKQKVNGKHLI